MNNNSVLYFFTSSYPYGTGETFIENEIEILCKRFENVLIFPNQIKEDLRSIPINAEVVKIPDSISGISVLDKLKFNFGLVAFSFKELIEHPVSSDSLRYRMAYFKQLYARYWNLKNLLKTKEIDNCLFYTFWLEEWATVLSKLKQKGIIDSFISRAHGFDIYEERKKDGFIPFRKFQLKMVDKVYCASIASMSYLKEKYKEYQSKITYAHLGVYDNGVNPISESEVFTIVSVSNIIPLKRVELIPEILKQFDFKTRWIHFGDGDDLEKLQKQIQLLPKNIEVELKGRVSNHEILKFYKSTPVDLFIHLSNSEGGVPVSIQEATSFGIPVIGTNAGGIPEIINNQTGVLLDLDFNPEEASAIVESFLKQKARNVDFRKGVRGFWQGNFDAEKNYVNFVNLIK